MSRKRVVITLSDDVYDVLQDLSSVMGVPACTIVSNLLKSLEPKMKEHIERRRVRYVS